jgi:hypothetical protein
MQIKSSLFWDISQRTVVFTDHLGQPVGTTFESKEIQEEIFSLWDRISS